MVSYLIFFLRASLVLTFFLIFSCKNEKWYKKEFSDEEKLKLSDQLLKGAWDNFYQGSVAEQLVLEQALEFNPENAAVWRAIGIPYLKRGMAIEADKYYKKAVEYDPLAWHGWRGYNYLYFYRDYERAIADFNATDTLTLNSTDYPQGQSVDYMRGLCYYGLNDDAVALKFFSKYIEEVTLEKDESWVDVYAFLYRGLTFERLGNTETAIVDFNKALKYYPTFSDPFYHLSRIYNKRGDYKKAKEFIEEAKKFFKQGYYHQRPYIEVQEQIYLVDIENLEKLIDESVK
ncbi:MAG: tetratricopeptide repeat protein [Bacteroidota bacterium]|nr:tetratricopeptide repeat protein [Bacteroidota bacterium]